MAVNAVGPNVGGSTFRSGCPVGVMGFVPTTRPDRHALLSTFMASDRRGMLASQLAQQHSESSSEEIDEAIQAACKAFLDDPHSASTVGEAYVWLRTAAHRILMREHERLDRLVPFDSHDDGRATSVGASAAQTELSDHAIDMERLVAKLVESLPNSKLEVLALYSAGHSRPEIAKRLGRSERTVKRYIIEALDQARAAIVRLSGGGCARGEKLIVREMCGLASPSEASRAQLHLARCSRCALLRDRLDLWREKAGALLPVPTGEQAAPGVVERAVHKAGDGLATVKQQLADVSAQAKQQATATYVRVADPTPLAGARPGAVAAVVAGCLAVGTGAYTCVEQGINPLTALPGLEQREPDRRAETPEKPTGEQPVPEPTPAPVVEQPAADPAPAPAAPEPAPAPEPPPPPPPPEQSFEPASPSYPSSQAAAEPQPAPVTNDGVPEFGGP